MKFIGSAIEKRMDNLSLSRSGKKIRIILNADGMYKFCVSKIVKKVII